MFAVPSTEHTSAVLWVGEVFLVEITAGSFSVIIQV